MAMHDCLLPGVLAGCVFCCWVCLVYLVVAINAVGDQEKYISS